MINNGYVKRGDLRVAPRSNIKDINIRSKKVASKCIGENVCKDSPTASALPTIPIYANTVVADCSLKSKKKYSDSTTDVVLAIPQQFSEIKKTKNAFENIISQQDNACTLTSSLVIAPEIKQFKSKKVPSKNQKSKARKIRNNFFKKLPLGLLLLFILGATGYVSYSTWQTNNQIKQALNADSSILGANSTDSHKATELNLTEANSSNVFGEHKVDPDLPRVIYINNIDVTAKVLPMGVNADMTLQSPAALADAGWYTKSAKPGKSGAMLIDGHTNATIIPPGVFSNIRKLNKGDIITIERGDGVKFDYEVVYSEKVAISELDMNNLLVPYAGADQGVNLITCTGAFTADSSTLDHRLIVYAVLKKNL